MSKTIDNTQEVRIALDWPQLSGWENRQQVFRSKRKGNFGKLRKPFASQWSVCGGRRAHSAVHIQFWTGTPSTPTVNWQQAMGTAEGRGHSFQGQSDALDVRLGVKQAPQDSVSPDVPRPVAVVVDGSQGTWLRWVGPGQGVGSVLTCSACFPRLGAGFYFLRDSCVEIKHVW